MQGKLIGLGFYCQRDSLHSGIVYCGAVKIASSIICNYIEYLAEMLRLNSTLELLSRLPIYSEVIIS